MRTKPRLPAEGGREQFLSVDTRTAITVKDGQTDRALLPLFLPSSSTSLFVFGLVTVQSLIHNK